MFEATGWSLEEPEVADQEKYDLIVPTIVKSPSGRGSDEVSETMPYGQPNMGYCCLPNWHYSLCIVDTNPVSLNIFTFFIRVDPITGMFNGLLSCMV